MSLVVGGEADVDPRRRDFRCVPTPDIRKGVKLHDTRLFLREVDFAKAVEEVLGIGRGLVLAPVCPIGRVTLPLT